MTFVNILLIILFMPITINDVERIASLAKLKLNENDKKRLLIDLNDVLGYMEIITEVDTRGVDAFSYSDDSGTALRDDTLTPGVKSESALKNAPASKDSLISVPRVINPRK